ILCAGLYSVRERSIHPKRLDVVLRRSCDASRTASPTMGVFAAIALTRCWMIFISREGVVATRMALTLTSITSKKTATRRYMGESLVKLPDYGPSAPQANQ